MTIADVSMTKYPKFIASISGNTKTKSDEIRNTMADGMMQALKKCRIDKPYFERECKSNVMNTQALKMILRINTVSATIPIFRQIYDDIKFTKYMKVNAIS